MRRSVSILCVLAFVALGLIGVESAAAESGGAAWIWHGDASTPLNLPACKRYFRRHVTIPTDRPIKSAVCSITADNSFVLFINGKRVGSGADWQQAHPFNVKAHLVPGKNVLAVMASNWRGGGGNPAGLLVRLRVHSTGAKPLVVFSDTQWKSSEVETPDWHEKDYDDSSWQATRIVNWSGWANVTLDTPDDGALPADLSKATIKRFELAKKTLALVEKHTQRPELAVQLSALSKQVEQAAKENSFTETLYNNVCSLRRRIIFSHPLLDFDNLLINKRPPPSYSHMSRQYLGRYSRGGPGLAVLKSWKYNPREKLLLDGKLPVGSVLHPDLSYDGKRILFSFCDHTQPDRNLRLFVLYEVGVDGSGLRQITGLPGDATAREEGLKTTLIEDWDPCYLPDGGIAFVSTRLQSHIRCQYGGRYFANFVLYRADDDGSNIRRISFNETCEWEPSLLDDGRLVYTRWDYVNRHFSYFQGLWVTRPDGTATAIVYKMHSRNPCMGTNHQGHMAHHGRTGLPRDAPIGRGLDRAAGIPRHRRHLWA